MAWGPKPGECWRMGVDIDVKRADIIIPVYKPTKKFLQLLDMLDKQRERIGKIILINTERKFLEALISEQELMDQYEDLLIRHIAKEEFDHGKTRNYGVSFSNSPYFVMLTDDCVPMDQELIRNLLMPFADPQIAVTYGRQFADKGCGVIEEFTRGFNYPETSGVKFGRDIPQMGIKAFFASNVCAAYRREVFDALGGFVSRTIFNEDMIYARKVLDKGYGIAYAAKARVIHSHHYSGIQQFHRNFDLGVSHAQHPEVFDGITAESEGIRLIKKSCIYLIRKGKPWLIIKLIWHSGCKYAGYFLGKRYQRLSRKMVIACSMNKDYWK